MGRKRSTAEKQEKKTPTKLAPISEGTEPWKVLKSVMKDMIADNPDRFKHLKDCTIRLWWNRDFKTDPDGVCLGAQVSKASELDRLLSEESAGGSSPAIFIKLPKMMWPRLDQDEKEYRMFEMLCAIRQSLASDGRQKRDAKDRLLWRIGRYPIRAYPEQVEKFGVDRVLGHNGAVVKAAKAADRPLLAAMEKANAAEDAADESAATAGSSPTADNDVDGWKRLAITELQLPPAVESFVIQAGYRRIGKFAEYMDDKADFWDRDLKVGGQRKPPNFREKIEEAFTAFWASHPEYTAG